MEIPDPSVSRFAHGVVDGHSADAVSDVLRSRCLYLDSFSTRLTIALHRVQNPVIVGLDPRVELLPQSMQPQSTDQYEVARSYREFCQGVIDVVAPLVAAVKPQSAFFEQYGPAGCQALADVIRYARDKGLLVIVDAKRNDIGSTAAAYAQAYLAGETSAWQADALTVSPYLGDDSLQPFIDTAVDSGCGVFVLVKTSNPGGRMLQDLVADRQPVYRHVADHIARLAEETADESGYGAVGAVVGATYPDELAELRSIMAHAWLLVPGYGSQGGIAADIAVAFDSHGLGAIINSSRAIIFAHTRPEYDDQYGDRRWQAAVEAATCDMIDEIHSVM